MNTKTDTELGSWTFYYKSEDGNGHLLTIHAPTFNEAVAIFDKTIGKNVSFIVKS